MHITNKAIAFIIFCVMIVFISYKYYAHEHSNWSGRSNDDTLEVIKATTTPSHEGALTPGETKELDGISITLNKVVEDSRCPVKVQCIWKCKVAVRTTLTKNGNTIDREVSDMTPTIFGEHVISITSVLPEKSTTTIKDTDYRITFLVTSTSTR
jgi:hypothetical protein